MELDQKLRCAIFAFSAATFVLAGLGIHTPLHLALEGGPGAD